MYDYDFPLTPSERKRLREFSHLARVWGYRAARDGGHTRYEDAIQEFRAAQEVTDIVFRNLQQITHHGGLYYGDVLGKLHSVDALGPDHFPNRFLGLLESYFLEVGDDFQRLSRSHATPGEHSTGYVVVIYAARALVKMNANDVMGALKLLTALERDPRIRSSF